jgi:hypothetical protein
VHFQKELIQKLEEQRDTDGEIPLDRVQHDDHDMSTLKLTSFLFDDVESENVRKRVEDRSSTQRRSYNTYEFKRVPGRDSHTTPHYHQPSKFPLSGGRFSDPETYNLHRDYRMDYFNKTPIKDYNSSTMSSTGRASDFWRHKLMKTYMTSVVSSPVALMSLY